MPFLAEVMRYRYWAGVGASIILGVIFIVAGLGKLLRQTEASWIVATLPEAILPPTLTGVVTHGLPWIELIVGSLLILGLASKLVASYSAVLISAFIANNSWLIYHGLIYEPCGCFGIFERVFLGKLSTVGSLYLDIGLLALVSTILLWYPGRFFAIHPWFLRGGKIAEEKD